MEFRSGARAGGDSGRSGRLGQGLGELAWQMWYGGRGAPLAVDKALVPPSPWGAACHYHCAQGSMRSRGYPVTLWCSGLCLRASSAYRRILEYLMLEGTRKDHRVRLAVPRRSPH